MRIVHSRIYILLFGLAFFAPSAQSDEDCTFSNAGVLESVKRIAEQFPGALIDDEQIRATWVLDNGDLEFYSRGGCHDLGGAAGRVTRMPERRNPEAVRAVIVELAQKFLQDPEAKLVLDAFEIGSDETDAIDSKEFIYINHPFGEIVVTHTFADGSDTVEIAWPIL